MIQRRKVTMAVAMRLSHQHFLQSFLSQGILDAGQVKELFKLTCQRFNEDYELKKLAEFVNTININIKLFHLEIRKGISEENGTNYYGLVNDIENDITKSASNYTPSEFEFVQHLIKGVLENEEGTLSSMQALNMTENLKNKKMSKKEVQEFIHKLEREHWILLDKGVISLGTRLVMEMEQFMKEQYPDIVVCCNLCKRICVKGQNCAQCDVRLHVHCARRLFKDADNMKCPECHALWPHEVEIVRRDASPQKAPEGRGSRKRRH